MSVRIESDGIVGAAASPVRPDGAVQPGSASRAGSTPESGTDLVEISSLSGKIAESIDALADQRAERVSHLAALYAKGAYDVDSRQLSSALVSDAISGSPAEGES